MPLEVHTKGADGKPFTAESFLEFLSLRNDRWWDGERQAYVFRGHGNSSWSLVPSCFRDPPSPEFQSQMDFFARKRSKTTQPSEPSIRLLALAQSHYDFARLAFEAGLLPERRIWNRYPDDYSRFDVSYEFSYLFCPYEVDEVFFSSAINFLGLAQHHGIPTHLLDWTSDPLVSAHFATKDWIAEERQSDIAVWCARVTGGEFGAAIDFRGRSHEVWGRFAETDIRSNLYAFHQKGCFSLLNHINGLTEAYVESGRYPSLEEVASNNQDGLELIKLILNRNEVPRLRKQLNRIGLMDHVLMPTLDEVAETAKLIWRGRSREK